MMRGYEPVIGLEVHAELLTRSKMFCGCAVVDSTTAEPNSSVCEICTGMPGTLPVINERAVKYALRVALALNCTISETSVFARKNYFYPDLPKGYQISQYELPLAENGWLEVDNEDSEPLRVRIRRVHLEEDTGKLLHQEEHTLVDYNRSGVPLLEIVSEPDLHSVDQTRSYALALRSMLRYLGVTSGDLQKGVMRFEANVSIRPSGSNDLGTRTEIKNLNSFRALSRAVGFEIERHVQVVEGGGHVRQETVGWDENREVTVSQRSKEEAHDYRYFPEPDLPPLRVDAAWIGQIKQQLPELPAAKRSRFVTEYELSTYTASVLTADRAVADYYEAAVRAADGTTPARIANWLSSDLFSLLNDADADIENTLVTPEALARLVGLVDSGTISAASGKEVLGKLFENGGSPEQIVEEDGLAQLRDDASIRSIVEHVLKENPEQVAEYLDGKSTLGEWFLGQVMRATQGKADPLVARAELESALAKLQSD